LAIIAGLKKLDPKSNVKIAIQTIDEAAAKRKNAGNPRITSVETLEFEAEGSESERELAKYFTSVEEARRFAAGVSSSSRSAMNHVYALRRLSRQFTTSEIKEMPDSARSKWTGLIRSHANSYSRGLARVSGDISRKFGGSGKGGGTVAAVSDVNQLIRNIDELQRVAAEIDRMVSSALSTSTQGRRIGDLQSARFWQLVDRAEELSASIAAYK
jgi:hypothetical protein